VGHLLADGVAEFLNLMLNLKYFLCSSSLLVGLTATSSYAASSGPVQMPKSSFDGAHNTIHWNPGSVHVETLKARLASIASWYGPGFYGNRTASGEVLRPGTLTAAHRSLPFGTQVRVTNLNNGRSTVVRINDRGPFVDGRTIDLSQGAAAAIGMISSGTAPVKLEVIR
jgi:rare lipoprotein A (peptidoglycan hydrolase)